MASVAIIYPRTGWDVPGVTTLLPLSILHVAAPLVSRGIDVHLLDQRTGPQWKSSLSELLQKGNLTCVGISSMTGNQISGGIEAAKIVRRHDPRTPLVWGGVHPSLLPLQTLESGFADVAVIGEGERTFADLVPALDDKRDLNQVKGIAFRSASGEIIETGPSELVDLDSVPELPYHLLDIKPYITSQTLGLKDLAMVTSRGCPHRCAYCYNVPFNRLQWRGQSAPVVLERIRELVRRFEVRAVILKDDNFFVGIPRAMEIAQGLLKSGLDIAIRAECRADYVSRKLSLEDLNLLRRAGFREFTIGVETGSDQGLKRLCKDITVEDVLLCNLKLRQAGIPTKFTFMAGFPWETDEDLKTTIRLMLRLIRENPGARVTPIHLFTPYPGTMAYDQAVEAGFSPPESLEAWSRMGFHEINHPWLRKSRARRLERISQSTYFLDGKTIREYFAGKRLIRLMIGIYGAVVRFRARHFWFGFMPELKIFDKIRGKSDKI